MACGHLDAVLVSVIGAQIRFLRDGGAGVAQGEGCGLDPLLPGKDGILGFAPDVIRIQPTQPVER